MSEHIKVELSEDLKKFMRRMTPTGIKNLMYKITSFYALKLQGTVVKNIDHGPSGYKISDTGKLKQSVHIRKLTNEVGYKVVAEKDYALTVETGSKPHYPPYKPLSLWLKRKLHVPISRLYIATKGLQRKIARFGTKPHPYLKPSADWLRSRLNRMGEQLAKFIESSL